MKIAVVWAILLVWTSCTEATCDADAQCTMDERSQLNFDIVESVVLASSVSRVHRYTAASYAANDPNEDRYVVQVDSDAVFASVLDGHGGWQVAEYVNKHLVNDTAALLRDVASNDPTYIASLLSSAFVATDDAMRTLLLPAFQLGFGEVNRVGACSMLAYAKEDTLVVANAGDVRAVLASIDASGGLVATPLSTDHNAKHASEQARLVADHPNESNLVMCQSREACYVKGGLQPTRALGDFAFKYEEFNTFPLGPKHKGGGRFIPQPYTPPYVLAVPEIQVHTLTDADHFLILGSDGLWDDLSNEEAVKIVAHFASRGLHNLAAQALIDQVIAKTADGFQVRAADIAALIPGRKRRQVHDDTTVVVLFFQPSSACSVRTT
ncbi:hypothetical protein H257_13064 [Aphanomyces astaci]|uniref:PPM-type phosphatase domain-containing protein n=1 Tax=Aphanomyces astaci TaxID=112090 RepID=W4FVU8_APHAT|nr:hypothetical protein H257_13064 [Aphanomyces astaci]ETV71602.1 hypothetical protein H257_13064 [Aphanomyces astaci]|eukprot:XP_009838790.1 hypothetical protein H257_13064 [Aphanomyces astaci]